MANPRIWYRYDYKIGNKIRHSGITQYPERREKDHQGLWPGGHLNVVGPAVTESAAREWAKTKERRLH